MATKKGTLPPMPPSDEGSLQRNKYDGFYRIRAREFWGDNEINMIKTTEQKKCSHEFEAMPTGARCSKCNFGLIGSIEVRDGKLFHDSKPLNL